MKKNYIAPSTVAQTWASMGLMQSIGFATNAASGGAGASYQTLDSEDLID